MISSNFFQPLIMKNYIYTIVSKPHNRNSVRLPLIYKKWSLPNTYILISIYCILCIVFSIKILKRIKNNSIQKKSELNYLKKVFKNFFKKVFCKEKKSSNQENLSLEKKEFFSPRPSGLGKKGLSEKGQKNPPTPLKKIIAINCRCMES